MKCYLRVHYLLICLSITIGSSRLCAGLSRPEFPVILIHGITGSADETWGEFTDFLVHEGWQFGGSPLYKPTWQQVSAISSGDFYAMNMSDYNSSPSSSQNLTFSEQGWEIAAVIAKVLAANPGKTKVILVAHSMGGLAARSYLQGLAKRDGGSVSYRRDVASLITICTPHLGSEPVTVAQELLSARGLLVRNLVGLKTDGVAVRELSPGSAALLTLNNLTANPLPTDVPLVSIVGTGIKLWFFPNLTGDGIVSAVSQSLANVPGTKALNHQAKELFILPRPGCDKVAGLSAEALALLNVGPTGYGIGHTCATSDGGVWAELIRQFRPASATTGGGQTVNPSTGSVDPSFSPLAKLSGNVLTGTRVYAVGVQTDGKVVIGGAFTSILGTNRNYIARLNADGSLDASFNPGSGANSTVYAMLIQPDGKIVIGGQFTTINGASRPRIARLNSDGSLDGTFNPGIGVNTTVYALGRQSDGKLMIGGAITSFGGAEPLVVRLNSNGALDSSFDFGKSNFLGLAGGTIYALALAANGQVIVGGDFTMFDSNIALRQRLIRLNSNGTLDTSFLNQASNPNAREPNSDVNAIAVQVDGRIIIAGGFSLFDTLYQAGIARLTSDGSFDTTFRPGQGVGQGGAVMSVAVHPDGKICIGGDFTAVSSSVRYGLARLLSDGTVDTTFIPALRPGSTVEAIAVVPGGLVVGGDFSLPNGRAFTARILTASQDPMIAVQPESRTVHAGEAATFSVSASGTLPLSYQWRFNGVSMSGATDSFLFLTNVMLSQSGDYSVVVNNAKGSIISAPAKLAVLPGNLPPHTPTNSLPANGAIDQSLVLTLERSKFSDPNPQLYEGSIYPGGQYAGSQWRILDASGTMLVWDSGEVEEWSSRVVPESAGLTYSTTYSWQVRYKDRGGTWSSYSTSTSFSTTKPLPRRNPVPVSRWPDFPRGTARGVAIAGSYAYVAALSGGLQIFNVQNPQAPVRLGALATGTYANSVVVDGNYAFVAEYSLVRIIDVTNPALPKEVGNFGGYYVSSVAVSGTYAYVVDDSGLKVIDISNAARPRFVGSLASNAARSRFVGSPAYGRASAIAVAGNYAYLATRGEGLIVVDISNAAVPRQLGKAAMEGLYAEAVAVSGKYVYVTGDQYATSGIREGGAIRVIDVSNPAVPKWVGGFNINGYVPGVAASASYAYIASIDNGLMVVDATTPSAATTVGWGTSVRGVSGVALSGNYAYLASAEKGLVVFDVRNARDPKEAGSIEISGFAHGVTVAGNLAYLADGDAGLRLVDVSDPVSPKLLGTYDSAANAPKKVSVSGDFAYLVDSDRGLAVIDTRQVSKPSLAGVFIQPNRSWTHAVAVSGRYAFVGADGGSQGLQIVDLANPAKPVLVARVGTDSIRAVTISGNYAYSAGMNPGGLRIFDISNPTNTKQVGSLPLPSQTASVAVSGNFAYLGDYYGPSLHVVDVSNPALPKRVARIDMTESNLNGLTVAGNYAYVANGEAGLQVIDVSNPAAPKRVGGFKTSGDAQDVTVLGDYAYVADAAWGLQVLYVGDGPLAIPTKASLTDPAPNSALTSSTAAFKWNSGVGVSQYSLNVGKAVAGKDYYVDQGTTNLLAVVQNLPMDGSAVYVRLWSRIGADWQFADYTYMAAKAQKLEIGIKRDRQELVLMWTDSSAKLEESNSVDGPWTAVEGAASNGYVVAISASRKFYRVRK